MISLTDEAEKMVRAMAKAAPLYGRVGAISIVAEDAVRQLHSRWTRDNRRSRRSAKARAAKAEGQPPPGPPGESED